MIRVIIEDIAAREPKRVVYDASDECYLDRVLLTVEERDALVAAALSSPLAAAYRPLVNLSTGREATAVGSALVEGFVRLEPTGEQGTYCAPDGALWVACSDSVWRLRP